MVHRAPVRRGRIAPHRWSLPFTLIALLLACDGPADDDDSAPGDDDTSAGDDDSSDDDDSVPWSDVLPEVDPEGDAGGTILDLRNLQFRAGDDLALRATGWEPFEDTDEALWLGVTVGDGSLAQRLTWIPGEAEPLQLWSSANRWAEPLDTPPSLTWEADLDIALVLSASLADLGLDGRCELDGLVEAGCAGEDCADVAPDDGAPVSFGLDAGIPSTVEARQPTIDDGGGGNGDGILDPGEYVEIAVAIGNTGCESTGGELAALLSIHPDSTADAALLGESAAYGQDPLAPGQSVAPDAPVEVALGAGTEPGQRLVLQLDVSDGDGGSWTAIAPALIVGKPREEPLAQVSMDGDDADTPFDAALVTYSLVDSELLISVFSYGVHDGDQVVEIHLDTDLDGFADQILSSLDPDSGAFSGSVRVFDPWDGWVAAEPPTTVAFGAGSDHMLLGVPLSTLGDPTFALLTRVVVADAGGDPVDLVPDEPVPGETGSMGLIATADAPFLRFESTQLTEIAGDGDGDVEAGESWSLKVQLRNDGPADALDAAGTVASTDPLFTLSDADLVFGPADPDGGTAWSLTGVTVDVDPSAPAGAEADLELPVTAAGYAFVLRIPLGLE